MGSHALSNTDTVSHWSVIELLPTTCPGSHLSTFRGGCKASLPSSSAQRAGQAARRSTWPLSFSRIAWKTNWTEAYLSHRCNTSHAQWSRSRRRARPGNGHLSKKKNHVRGSDPYAQLKGGKTIEKSRLSQGPPLGPCPHPDPPARYPSTHHLSHAAPRPAR